MLNKFKEDRVAGVDLALSIDLTLTQIINDRTLDDELREGAKEKLDQHRMFWDKVTKKDE